MNARSRWTPECDIDTEGALFDYLQRLFGVGSYDEVCSEEPYWQWRMHEITKIKAKRNKFKVAVQDLALAAEYCKVHHIDIRNPAFLYDHLGASRHWMSECERALSVAQVDDEIEAALAVTLPDSPWFERLVRASGENRKEVLSAWKTWHDSQGSPATRSSPPSSRSGGSGPVVAFSAGTQR